MNGLIFLVYLCPWLLFAALPILAAPFVLFFFLAEFLNFIFPPKI